ncbi:MAG TPA: aminotransferase class I/II-fold pyridoxal phosphate-dependent enzyme [Niabella sp.]|nr:aminotransferase class I/II-fold pyridoxal phosphate-dependent enzyme [Niabella sp.]HQW14358.1 aminotransferase class I/II-fold pyridoxal phosphate-dependent enzyme [Niabella sp.]HQX18363.1 aminotransferase class I/II-fold pyridoxal phosphate-dependent enzyme [Niabella sp.]HQX40145.1 aminotransferase class I/II-fold pyridoxal phosphate-dependent enzyme [Niabella sp.]HRB05888.1 aminotransferase class I/II-fold pyridoxal phosphate-dependent enzyme [Niabella sp.]
MKNNYASTRSAENFSLKDFCTAGDVSLDERVNNFSDWIKDRTGSGDILYRRLVMGKMDRVVTIKDPFTGQQKNMLMFGSNNYLGLATHPYVLQHLQKAIQTFGHGIGGPPLLNGYTRLHHDVEESLALLKGTEDCLITASGYMANLSWVNGLLSNGDTMFFDEHNHSSVFFGLSTVKCRKIPFRHNDLNDLEDKLKQYRKNTGDYYLVVEGVYSMDGDLCPLPELMHLVYTYHLKLIIDDAHGTGVKGKNGGGLTNHFNIHEGVFLHVGTFSKALASIGGFVAGDKKVIDYLRYMAAPYMFSASAPPTILGTVFGGLEVIKQEPGIRQKLFENIDQLVKQLSDAGIEVEGHSPIIPIIVPQRGVVKNMSIELHHKGLFVNSVVYPAVPENKERLRISLSAVHSKDDIDRLAYELIAVLKIKEVI